MALAQCLLRRVAIQLFGRCIPNTDSLVSAYGNNREIRVREGEDVKAGQMLAEAGITSSNVEMLHFEIRRDGKPKDPIGYLPKK